MALNRRDEVIGVRMSSDESHMLRVLADADGISQSDVLRMLVRREWIARFGPRAPAAKKTKV